MEFRQISVGDCALNVLSMNLESAGDGNMPLVFVHGFPLDHTMWTGQFLRLAPRPMVAIDLCGFGRSAVVSGKRTMSQMADDVSRVLDELGIADKIALCGLSMGGYVSFAFWRRHAPRLAKLVLCDTRAVADPPAGAEKRLGIANRLEKERNTAFLTDEMLPKLFAKSTHERHPKLVEATRRVMLSTSFWGAAAAQRGMAERENFEPHLSRIDIPTLVVCGKEDAISPAAEMRGFAAKMPKANFAEMNLAGHMAPLEQPMAFNATLEAFLAS